MILSGKVLYEINEEDINVEKKTLRIGDGVKEMWDRCNINIRKEIREQITIIDFNELETIEKISGCTVCTVFPNVEVVLMPKVKAVAENMFEKCQKLRQISMISVESIREAAFRNCTELHEVFLPSIKYIGNEAFAYCESLKIVSLGKMTKEIRFFAFSKTAIETIDLGDAKVDLRAFDDCKFLRSLSIDTLHSFDKYALSNCNKLEKLIVRDTEYAFIEKAPYISRGKSYSLIYDDDKLPFAPEEKQMICCSEKRRRSAVTLALEYIQQIDVNTSTVFSRIYVLKNGNYVAEFGDGNLSSVSDSISSLSESEA